MGEQPDVLLSDMHSVFKCLNMKERVSGQPLQTGEEESSRRRALDQWVETTRLFTFDEIPTEDARFASDLAPMGRGLPLRFP